MQLELWKKKTTQQTNKQICKWIRAMKKKKQANKQTNM